MQRMVLDAAERERLLEMSVHEIRLRRAGYRAVAGIDEAGRGPLAGPVVAAACILPESKLLAGLNDSKQIKENERERLFEQIQSDPEICFGIGIIEAKRIDEINILQATFEAMQLAVKQLPCIPDYLLIDGNRLPQFSIPAQGIVKGDTLSVYCSGLDFGKSNEGPAIEGRQLCFGPNTALTSIRGMVRRRIWQPFGLTALVRSIGRALCRIDERYWQSFIFERHRIDNMLISMTGFGRSVRKSVLGRVTVEIQSVNRKYLEFFISLPKELALYEMDVRKWVAGKIGRGQVAVRLFLSPSEEALVKMLPNAALLRELKRTWTALARESGCDEGSIDLPFLLQALAGLPQNGSAEWSEEKLQIVKEGVFEALDAAIAMKLLEGKALEEDISVRLEQIGHCIRKSKELSFDQAAKQRNKLKERMKEVLEPGSEFDERLLREIAFFAERVDVAEEITRMQSHLEQFRSVLDGSESAVGRKLEFVVQEMGREINTIGSKSQDAAIAHLVIEMKSELEKIREQIQNVE